MEHRVSRLESTVYGWDANSGLARMAETQAADLREVRQQVRDFRVILDTSLVIIRWVLLLLGTIVGAASSGTIAAWLAGLHTVVKGGS